MTDDFRLQEPQEAWAGARRPSTYERLVYQLKDLTKRWNDHEDIPRSQQIECRVIGERLLDAGGENLMREAYREAKNANQYVTVIQAYWDGVGDWRW